MISRLSDDGATDRVKQVVGSNVLTHTYESFVLEFFFFCRDLILLTCSVLAVVVQSSTRESTVCVSGLLKMTKPLTTETTSFDSFDSIFAFLDEMIINALNNVGIPFRKV